MAVRQEYVQVINGIPHTVQYTADEAAAAGATLADEAEKAGRPANKARPAANKSAGKAE